MSPSGKHHNRLVWAIVKYLSIYDVASPGTIEMVIQEAWMRTRNGHDRLGDIAVYLVVDEPQPEAQYDMVPGIIFEVVSEGSEERDYIIKRKEYFDLGVREYVIVDSFRKILTVLTRGRQDYTDRELKPGERYTPAQLPGFALSVEDLPWS